STIFVDSLLKRDEYVENVEKLSPLFVDNWLTSVMLWKMWKSCPQLLWITLQRDIACRMCGKTCLSLLWVHRKRCKWSQENELSTNNVDNSVEKCAEVT